MYTSAKQAAKALQKKVWANEISDLGPRSAICNVKKTGEPRYKEMENG